MDLSTFKKDIDELIDEFAEGELTTLTDLKKVWLSKKFTFIYEASPSTNLSFFMQSLYAYTIRHMVSTASISRRLGGLYCLYCLYETQPFKPPFKIYLSLGELEKLKNLVVETKDNGIRVVSALVKMMLEKNIFLFGSVDLSDGAKETVNQLTELQNARVKVAYDKLFSGTRIEHFIHMDLGMEVDMNAMKKLSTEYADTKKQAIEEASKVVDVQNIKHISQDKELMRDAVEKIIQNWNVQKEVFYQQTRLNQHPALEGPQKCGHHEQQGGDEDFEEEIEHLLLEN